MKKTLTNRQIQAAFVRLVREGQSPEKMPLDKALAEAERAGLDLVQASSNDDPEPICKLIDYGKMMYTQKKMQSKTAHVKNETKEIRLSFNISEHDLDVKARKAIEFLDKRARVKLNLQLKGRERQNVNLAMEKLLYFAGKLVEFGSVETKPVAQGRSVSMIIKPIK